MARRSRRLSLGGVLALALALVALLALAVPAGAHAVPRPAPGDPLPRIACPPGYTARVYAQGLIAPDGLAFSPSGTLHVAEERAGRVSRIDDGGTVVPVLEGLNSPEGIAFDPQTGDLYVVEDVKDGRLVKQARDGTVTSMASGLEAPEGVTWVDGTVYLTESNLEFAPWPNWRTRVAALPPGGALTRVITDTPLIEGTQVRAWSYAGIAAGPDGRLYVANELSGLANADSVFAVDPETGTRVLFASGLTATEGLRFSPGGGFPLYVVEEDLGDGEGRIGLIDPGGQHTPLCTGFLAIEDVIVDAAGTLYVSEDGSGTVIAIEPPVLALQADFDAAPRTGIAPLAVVFTNTSRGSYQARLWEFGDGQTSVLEHPTHTYPSPGSYSVSLTVVGPEGSDTRTCRDCFTVWWGSYLPLAFRP